MSEYIESGTTRFFSDLKKLSEAILTVASLGQAGAAIQAARQVKAGAIISNKMRQAEITSTIKESSLSASAELAPFAESLQSAGRFTKDAEELAHLATEAKLLLCDALKEINDFEKWLHRMRDQNKQQFGRAYRSPSASDPFTKYNFTRQRDKIRDKIEKCAERYQECLDKLDKIVNNLSRERKEFSQYKRDLDTFWNKFATVERMLHYLR